MKRLFYFSTPNCGPCRAFYPVLLEYLADKNLELIKIDLSEENNFQYKEEFNLTSVPTVLLLDGIEEVGRVVGADLMKLKELIP